MKIAVIVVRVLIALLFLFSVVGYVFKLMPQPELPENAKLFTTGLFASGYMMPMVKVIEFACAIALLVNRFVPLALVIIFPIVVNIFMFHGVTIGNDIAIPLFLLIGVLFLAYNYRKHYQTLVLANPL